MIYRVAYVRDAKSLQTVNALQTLCLPSDELVDPATGWAWLVTHSGEPVAFATMHQAATEPASVYLSRCGVLSGHRGHGLQRRLLKARLDRARLEGFAHAITTTYANPHSANNLIRCGFLQYVPKSPWGVQGTDYWRRRLAPTP